MTRRKVLAAMFAGVASGCASRMPQQAMPPHAPLDLIVCGGDEVFILALAEQSGLPPRKIWSWRAAECPDIPESLKRRFQTTDDCKPVNGGRCILISSSSGAVALVERRTGRSLFHAEVVNAHSIEMLPGGRIAAAASVANSPAANRVILFDIAGRRELASDSMVSAHGLVWDDSRSLLWALGGSQLRAYRLANGAGDQDGLTGAFQTQLPDSDGHDLSPVPGTSLLFISTGKHCWHFDRNTRQIALHDTLKDAPNVKSYSIHPKAARVAYVQAEGRNWWAEHIHFHNPDGVLRLPGQRLYKARWVH